jgi:S1-C subfamily serine protease
VLAETVPALGSQVWLVAKQHSGASADQIMHSGKVVNVHTRLIFQFDDDKLITRGASGAPVVNAEGEVVGVYTGDRIGLANVQGHLFGFAIPAPLIAATIKEAVAQRPAPP